MISMVTSDGLLLRIDIIFGEYKTEYDTLIRLSYECKNGHIPNNISRTLESLASKFTEGSVQFTILYMFSLFVEMPNFNTHLSSFGDDLEIASTFFRFTKSAGLILPEKYSTDDEYVMNIKKLFEPDKNLRVRLNGLIS